MKFPLNKKTNGKKKAGEEPGVDSSSAESPMDVSLLERLVKLMAANDLNTVDVRDGERRVILKRGPAMVAGALPAFAAAPVQTSATPASASVVAGAKSEAGDEEAGLIEITSPMVGTFYASPAPDAKAFVAVGSTVEEETDVCVIEAMKVFNNIKAECRGKIARILVSNGQTVEFGEVLFLVKPQ